MSNHYRWTTFVWSVWIGFLTVTTVVLGLTGCDYPVPHTDYYVSTGDAGGGEESIIDLPFAAGYQSLCTQGVNGTYSHQSNSTKNDIDLDTPNGENDLVYAPAGGVARVHTESASRNFGYHVNIDLGDDTYVVVAHMADVFVSDGEEVAAGEMIGYEGCTGSCSGDHVHVGLHDGDAAKMAEYGTSESVSYWVNDATSGAEGLTLASAEFVCDTGSGHKYESKLAVPSWHPNGSLVKTPDDANVYLIENGTRRWIETEDVFWSLDYDFQDVALVSPAELACYDVGSVIDAVAEMPREYVSADGETVLREGDLVKEESTSDVYAVSDGVAVPIESYNVLLKLGWGSRFIVTVADGDVAEIVGRVGNCAVGVYCLSEEAIEQCATEGATDLSDQGGAEDGGTEEDLADEEQTDTGSETENVDPSSMLEGEIDDGEFGFAFLPPSGFEAIESLLIGTVVTDDGNVLSDAKLLEMNTSGGEIVYSTNEFPNGGVSFYFIVQESEEMAYDYGCELDSNDQPELWGNAYAQFGENELAVDLATSYDTGIGCTLKVHVPSEGVDTGLETDSASNEDTAEPVDTGEVADTAEAADTGSGSGSSVYEASICYNPGDTLVAGELYLDGGFFTAWDTAPASSASYGDTEMCATEKVVSGESVKVNGWYIGVSSSSLEWAAFNNSCLSIDWQGVITVDGTVVSVTTAPWSTAAWASDPCLTGGDGFFTAP